MIAKVAKRILNNSANKKGWAPNLNIGLSQPINPPSHTIPNIYTKLIAKVNLRKFKTKLLSYLNFPETKAATTCWLHAAKSKETKSRRQKEEQERMERADEARKLQIEEVERVKEIKRENLKKIEERMLNKYPEQENPEQEKIRHNLPILY